MKPAALARRLARVGLRATLAGIVVVAVLLGTTGFLAATPTGFAWLVAGVNRLAGEQLRLEHVDGHLGAPLSVGTLVWSDEWRRITVSGLRFEWRPRALLERRLDVALVAAERVEVVERKPRPPEPLTAPTSLRLPLDLAVQRAALGELVLAGSGTPLRFGGIEARLTGAAGAWRLDHLDLATPWGTLAGNGSVGQDAPFTVTGHVDFQRPLSLPGAAPAHGAASDTLRARLALSGALADLGFDLNAAALDVNARAFGAAAPFARIRLPRLVVAASGLDPRRLSPDAPAARLALSGAFHSDADDRLLGSLAVDNALPGRLDRQRLPFAGLTAVVEGDATHAVARDLSVDLGAAGRLAGDAEWQDGRFHVQLTSDGLDLAALHGRLVRSALKLGVTLSGDAATQTVDIGAGERWGAGWLRLTRNGDTFTLDNARFEGAVGRLAANGRWQGGTQGFDASVDLADVDPSKLGDFPSARLQLRGSVSGALTPQLVVRSRFELPPGTLEGRPLSGSGRLRIEPGRLADADVALTLAGNRIALKGAAGGANDVLTWDIAAPELARLKLGFGGALDSRGRLAGDWRAPSVSGTARARELALPGDVRLAALDLDAAIDLGRAPAAADAPFRATLTARGLAAAGQRLDSLALALSGTRGAHRLQLDAARPGETLRFTAHGGLGDTPTRRGGDTEPTWRGSVDELQLTGDWPLRLLAPVPLTASRSAQTLADLKLAQGDARIEVDTLHHETTPTGERRWSTRGRLAHLAVVPLLARLRPDAPVTGDLVLGGEWSLAAATTLDGRVKLARESGDLALTDPKFALQLKTLALDATLAGNSVDAALTLASGTRAAVLARARTTLALTHGIPGLPVAAPLSGSVDATLPTLAPLRPFLPPDVRADAALAVSLKLGGEVRAPTLDGTARATDLRLALPEQGVRITGGTLGLTLAGRRVEVSEGELKGTRGRVLLSGDADLGATTGGVKARFERFAAVDRADRRIDVSGDARLTFSQKRLALGGTLKVDRARLKMPEASRPHLSDDVIVAGRPPPQPASPLPLDLDLTIDLGDDTLFDGAGLDARLAGNLRVYTVAGKLRGDGAIRVADGRYSAYGQTLDIQRGTLRFSGALDNPALDILAVRKTATVTAGVQVTGSVRVPRASLYSDPALPDAEKLSWLVLGRGLDGGGAADFALLQVAAGAVFNRAQSVNVQAQIADTLGIDSFDVRAGDNENLESAVVEVGKRLSANTTLTYGQSLNGLTHMVKIVHQLSRHLRLEATTGEQSSFDAVYSIDYD